MWKSPEVFCKKTCFSVRFETFLRTPILKNICKRLLLVMSGTFLTIPIPRDLFKTLPNIDDVAFLTAFGHELFCKRLYPRCFTGS